MKILVWNINTFGGHDEQKHSCYDKTTHKRRAKTKQEQAAFAEDGKRTDIERRIFQYVRGENPDICLVSEFDCQARSAAKDFILSMQKEGWTKFYPETSRTKTDQKTDQKEKEDFKEKVYFTRNYSLPLCFARECLLEKMTPNPTLGDGKWARINELEIGGCVFIAVHMNDDPKLELWKALIKHAVELLNEKKPVIIAGDFNAFLPGDINYNADKSEAYAQKFAELLDRGFIDLTPKGVSTFCGERHDDHLLTSPALAKLFGKSRFSVTIDGTVIDNNLSDHACLILNIPLPESGAEKPVPQDDEQTSQSIEEYERDMIGEEAEEEEGRDYFQDEMDWAGYTDEDYGEAFDGDYWDVD